MRNSSENVICCDQSLPVGLLTVEPGIQRVEQNRLFQLEGTDNDHLVHQPEHFGADQKFQHVAEGTVQMPLGHRQVWSIDPLCPRV